MSAVVPILEVTTVATVALVAAVLGAQVSVMVVISI